MSCCRRRSLAAALEAGHVTRKPHPELPLSIYTYTRTCQYERVWNRVTTRCRGLVADDGTGEIVALPLPKFFNVGEHEAGQPYAPSLPDEPFEVYDKVDGSLAVVFHYAGRWRVASKGSFVSAQATWAQRLLDGKDTSGSRSRDDLPRRDPVPARTGSSSTTATAVTWCCWPRSPRTAPRSPSRRPRPAGAASARSSPSGPPCRSPSCWP